MATCAAFLATNVTHHPHETRVAQSLRRGSAHRGLRRVFALVTFGYELELLTLQMRVLQREVSRYLVAEATSTYHAVNRGVLAPSKPAVLSEAIGNHTFPLDLAAMTTVVVLHAAEERSRCKARFQGPHGCWEARHRAVLLDELLAVANRDDDMALLADVDEIASPSVVRLLRRCAPLWHKSHAPDAPHKYTLQAWSLFYGVHCWPRVATWKAPHAYSVAWLRKRLRDDRPPMSPIEFLDTRADVSRPPMVRDAGWHFTSTGTSVAQGPFEPASLRTATHSACHAQSHSSLGRAWGILKTYHNTGPRHASSGHAGLTSCDASSQLGDTPTCSPRATTLARSISRASSAASDSASRPMPAEGSERRHRAPAAAAAEEQVAR